MQTIGLIGAMEAEVKTVKGLIQGASTASIARMTFTVGSLNGKQVVLACCGIGKVNAAVATQLLITEFKASTVFNLGTAGAIAEDLDVGHVVVAKDFVYHDFDMMHLVEGFPRIAGPVFLADQGAAQGIYGACARKFPGGKVRLGRVVSGDRFISSHRERVAIQDQFAGACVDMEGASIAQVCYLNKVPFASCKVISDRADEKASTTFQDFLQAAGPLLAEITTEAVGISE